MRTQARSKVRHPYHNLFRGNVLIITPSMYGKVGEILEKYLRDKANKMAYITHLAHICDISCQCKFYDRGRFSLKTKFPFVKFPENLLGTLLAYPVNMVFTLFSVLSLRTKFDVCIGIYPFNALIGLGLQKLGFIRETIYYQLDYMLFPSDNSYFSKIAVRMYQKIDKICNDSSSIVWNLTPALIDIKKKRGIITQRSAPQTILRHGVDARRVKKATSQKIDKTAIGFIGALRRDAGIQLVIEALSEIVEEIQDVKVHIIGSGTYEKELKRLATELGLEKHVHFHGVIEDEDEVFGILSKCACGVAPFTLYSYARYGEPGKLKTYMECGLPMIVTRVPLIAYEIEENKAGIVIDYSRKELISALMKLLLDEEKLREYRKNVMEFASKFYWENVFKPILDGQNAFA